MTTWHAVTRALATANLTPSDATFRVRAARAWVNSSGAVARGEVTLSIRKARPLGKWEPHELQGWVNPDGEHPLMTVGLLPDPTFVDVLPVSWARWQRTTHEPIPEGHDPMHPRTGLDWETASAWAEAQGARLPTTGELRALWGDARFPWGDRPDPRLGRDAPPSYGALAELAEHPPIGATYDLGAWLWVWTAEGRVACGAGLEAAFGRRSDAIDGPIGVRLVLTAGP